MKYREYPLSLFSKAERIFSPFLMTINISNTPVLNFSPSYFRGHTTLQCIYLGTNVGPMLDPFIDAVRTGNFPRLELVQFEWQKLWCAAGKKLRTACQERGIVCKNMTVSVDEWLDGQ